MSGNFHFATKKAKPNRTRRTYGGNNLVIKIDLFTPTVDLKTVKLLLNSVISTSGAKFVTLDIKGFYLTTPMEELEFFRKKIKYFPQDVVDYYIFKDKVDEKITLYVRDEKGIYCPRDLRFLVENGNYYH